jgi:hypothetical protein
MVLYLDPEIGYLGGVFSWLSSAPPGECWDSELNDITIVSFYIHPYSIFAKHPVV